MKVKVKLTQPFSGAVGRIELIVSIERGDLAALLEKLCSDHPPLRGHVFDEGGNVMDHLNIFVNQVPVTSDQERDMKVKDGDEVILLMAVGGG